MSVEKLVDDILIQAMVWEELLVGVKKFGCTIYKMKFDSHKKGSVLQGSSICFVHNC